MLKNGQINLEEDDNSHLDKLKDYQKQAYSKNLGGRQRHREVFRSGDELDHPKSGYSNSQVRRMVSKIRDSMKEEASQHSKNSSINADRAKSQLLEDIKEEL